MSLRSRVLVCALALASAVSFAQQTLDNAAVVKLAKAGLSDDLIIQTINSSPGHFALGTDDLIGLKKDGVSERVIGAMFGKNMAPAGAANPIAPVSGNGLPAGVDEIGTYYQDHDGTWKPIAPEIIHYKSGGFMKSLATDGIIKQDRNGNIAGKTAKLTVAKPVNILLYVPEGVAPEEYQLLKLRVNSSSREFRSQTGGVFHSSGGAQRDSIEFKATKLAPRVYQFTIEGAVEPGEYGVLPPGAVSTANAASEGKMFTFRIAE